MKISTYVLIMLLMVFLSGCIIQERTDMMAEQNNSLPKEPAVTIPMPSSSQNITGVKQEKRQNLLIDRISIDLTSFHDKKWNTLYQADELDCSRMSTYFWDYIRTNHHIAPRIIVSYERQHAWLALKVSDVGNSTEYSHWKIKGTDYYFLEATIPRIVADDGRKFLINDKIYTSAEFYNAAIYVFDTPQDANDFHAGNSQMGGWNQEFRLKKDDLDRIARLLQ